VMNLVQISRSERDFLSIFGEYPLDHTHLIENQLNFFAYISITTGRIMGRRLDWDEKNF
jgi:hypothetical protein